VTFFVGHFGSGKTEIALNAASRLARKGVPITLADLDVVKPYFRSRAARSILADLGVELLAPTGENIHSDLPIIVPQIRSALREPRRQMILDVGGDDSGARVLGSLTDVIPVHESDCLVVLNFRRPSTPDTEGAVAMVRDIEATAQLRVTGLISNTHLMNETTPEVVLEGHRLAQQTAHRLEIPIRAVTAVAEIADALDASAFGCPVVVLDRIVMPPHEQQLERRTTGPLFVVN
jgi:hypothetical protein